MLRYFTTSCSTSSWYIWTPVSPLSYKNKDAVTEHTARPTSLDDRYQHSEEPCCPQIFCPKNGLTCAIIQIILQSARVKQTHLPIMPETFLLWLKFIQSVSSDSSNAWWWTRYLDNDRYLSVERSEHGLLDAMVAVLVDSISYLSAVSLGPNNI
jgi:hypothetical protein